ncbi:MAG TPA: NAD-dependent epimerase/dehydratase family protein [Streptosporangiaceae bacterium]|jgi:nucleoside-diphosphate-sugar epimerase
MRRALVVGGTGQTGPLVVRGLLDRGYAVTILHGGQHEVASPGAQHIHADVHFLESITRALDGLTFDVAVCMYGRSRFVAEALRGKVPRIVMVTGAAYAFREPRRAEWGPFGVTAADENAPFSDDKSVDRLGTLVAATERHVLDLAGAGHYHVTILRYPRIYGPGCLSARIHWSVVRRILDARPFFIVADGGLRLTSRAYRDNAAHALLLAVDAPERPSGRIYNVADDPPVLTIGQEVQALADALGHQWELLSLPSDLVERVYLGYFGYHCVLDTTRIRAELGYQDLVPAPEALDRTARWWAEHGPSVAGAVEPKMADRFDYAAEDNLVRSYRLTTRDLLADAPAPLAKAHPFRHPTAPGQEWTQRIVVEGGHAQADAWHRATYPYDLS